jgi:hypothetical protein
MKLDMANFHIQQMRPHIQLKSIEYERQKFQEFLDNHSSNLDIKQNYYFYYYLVEFKF